ncbi:MAG TPA: DUF817 domain-containing protein [Hyphomicrobiaceae bacterium]|nr:DUF817 domain-containing protein [Hyphomicrobiaceae bacterium]
MQRRLRRPAPAGPTSAAATSVDGAPPAPESGARHWAPLARAIDREARVGAWAARRPATLFLYELLRFGLKQAWACLFGALLLALLIGTHLFYPNHAPIPRYDALLAAAIAIQAGMLAFRLETWEEARVIAIFHVVGTVMEIFKTSMGSWVYPEASLLRLGGVPLFTGFMYAAIGSYIARCWRLFDFRFDRHPPLPALGLISVGIYLNFFAHHYVWDLRLGLFALTAALFARTSITFRVWRVWRRMPLLLGFALVALFIWFAENIGTFTAAWMYPHQRQGWTLVASGKLGAWFLLMIISYALVAMLNGLRRPPPGPCPQASPPAIAVSSRPS